MDHNLANEYVNFLIFLVLLLHEGKGRDAIQYWDRKKKLFPFEFYQIVLLLMLIEYAKQMYIVSKFKVSS